MHIGTLKLTKMPTERKIPEAIMTGREKKQNKERGPGQKTDGLDRNYFSIKRNIKNPVGKLRCTNISLVCSKPH